jgi:hypothetical protein
MHLELAHSFPQYQDERGPINSKDRLRVYLSDKLNGTQLAVLLSFEML